MADGRWVEALGILQEIVQTENKGLVLVRPGTAGNVATYVNVATRCNVLMSRASKEGRLAYRQKVDPQAKRWFEAWQRTRDDAELLRIVHHAFLSSYGDDALLALGESAWDRGEFSAARSWWEQLVPLPDKANPANYPTLLRYPDAEFDQPTILARTVMCSILEREPIRAAEEIRQFSERYPTAEGWLAGKQGILCDLLRQTLDESKQWPQEKSIAAVETFALSPSRYRRISESIDVGALRWARNLLPTFLNRLVDPVPFKREPLSYFPVVYGKIVLVNDWDSIRAWNILTGEPAWQSDRLDSAIIYPSSAEEPSTLPDQICVGVPFYTMTIDSDRLYARMGSPVTSMSNRQRDLESDLVCLDLTQEGKLIWKISSREMFNEENWRFEGTPVIVAGHAYVAVSRRRPQLEIMVVCMDASDGHLLWQRPVGGFRSSVADNFNRVSHLLLTAAGGRVFLSTDVGAIVALDDTDGRLEWAATYESRTEESPTTQSNPQRKCLLPPLYHQGLLFVAPNDADFAMCLKADSGQMEWKYPYVTNSLGANSDLDRREQDSRQLRENHQWHQLLGVADGGAAGRLIVASGSSLSAIDIVDGSVVMTTPKIENSVFGRGLLVGDQILLPGRETIEVFSQRTLERTTNPILLKTPDSAQQGGNLTFAEGMLLVTQPDRLSAYFEYSVLKERIERELTSHPDTTSIELQLAEIDAANGRIEDAVKRIQQISEQHDQDEPEAVLARQTLSKLLQDAGTTAFRENKLVAAREYWLRAMSCVDDAARRIRLTFELTRVEEALNHPENAIEHLQTILSDEQLAEFPRDLRSVGQVAADQMSRLIAEHGRNAYASIEAIASTEFDKLKLVPDAEKLRNLIRSFPHASILNEARQVLARHSRETGDISQAYAALDEIRRSSVDDRAFVESTIAMVELLDDSHNSQSASRLLSELATCDPATEVVFAGQKRPLGDVIERRLRSSEAPIASQPMALERTWSHPLSNDAQVIIPKREPPSAELASLLICTKSEKFNNRWLWRCLNWVTGDIRWEETATNPIQVAGWNDVELLIGTSHGWEARSPSDGRQVWKTSAATKSTPLFAGGIEDFDESGLWPASFDLDRGLRLFDPHDGQLVVTIKPPGRLHGLIGFGHTPNDRESNGESAAVSDKPEQHQSVRTAARSKSSVAVFMQTTKPIRTWIATAPTPRNRWSMRELNVESELWNATPLVIHDRIIGITNDFHLVGQNLSCHLKDEANTERSHVTRLPQRNTRDVKYVAEEDELIFTKRLDDAAKAFVMQQLNRSVSLSPVDDFKASNANTWRFKNFPTGQVGPIGWIQSETLVTVADGSLLMSFDPFTGIRKYSSALSDFPMQHPGNQIGTHGELVFAASQGILRGMSIRDGKLRFEKYLGDTASQWKTTVAWTARPRQEHATDMDDTRSGRCLLAVWGLNLPDQRKREILFCDSETGEITQRLRVESEPREFVLREDGCGILWTEKCLTGLKKLSTSE